MNYKTNNIHANSVARSVFILGYLVEKKMLWVIFIHVGTSRKRLVFEILA